MVLRLLCSSAWGKTAENNDPQGRKLEILKGIHEMTFKDHVCKIANE
jgi:hypothetical protein